MALINHEKKEINAKIVFYGPGSCGKTTNIKFLYEKMKPEYRGKLKFLNTRSGKMLFFDFMRPDQIGIQDYDVRFHVYTVPGEISDYSIWKTVLKGMDGLVFVTDSEPYRLPDNLQCFEQLTEYLATLGKEIKDIPCLLQCNKQDVPGATTIEEMKDLLHSIDCPIVPASAKKGEGILNTLSNIVRMVLQKLRETPLDAEQEEKHAQEAETPAPVERTEEIQETPVEAIPPIEEEILSEPLTDTAPHQEFVSDSTSYRVESAEPEPSLKASETDVTATEVDFSGEMEQIAPGHLRLPVTIKYGQETKRVALNLKLSIETLAN